VKAGPIAEIAAVTRQDGTFTIAQVPPGEYFVRMSSYAGERLRTEFRPEEADVVDQDLETTFWPGGLSAPSGNGLIVSSGALTSIGTITIRKAPRYRIRISTHGSCPSGERMLFMANDGLNFTEDSLRLENTTCAPEFLIENVRSGPHVFTFSIGQPGNWAVLPIEVASRNLEADITFSPPVDITARLVAADRAALPPLSGLRVRTRALDMILLTGGSPVEPDEDGAFTLKSVMWPRHRIEVEGLGPKYYVKEVRYNDRFAEGSIFTPLAGGKLAIVIDDKAAAIAGTVTVGDKPATDGTVIAIKWPIPEALNLRDDRPTGSIGQGQFKIAGLAPGEYRVFAVSRENWIKVQDIAVLKEFASRAESVRLGPSESRTVTLKLLE
jgi:hypothetical protein